MLTVYHWQKKLSGTHKSRGGSFHWEDCRHYWHWVTDSQKIFGRWSNKRCCEVEVAALEISLMFFWRTNDSGSLVTRCIMEAMAAAPETRRLWTLEPKFNFSSGSTKMQSKWLQAVLQSFWNVTLVSPVERELSISRLQALKANLCKFKVESFSWVIDIRYVHHLLISFVLIIASACSFSQMAA